jgi:hypothetical protein
VLLSAGYDATKVDRMCYQWPEVVLPAMAIVLQGDGRDATFGRRGREAESRATTAEERSFLQCRVMLPPARAGAASPWRRCYQPITGTVMVQGASGYACYGVERCYHRQW